MSLMEIIRQDLKVSMKARTEERTSALRVILGEFQRQGKKDLSDNEVVAVLRKLIKAENETLAITKAGPTPYLQVLEGYLPKAPSEAEVREWIAGNIDFGSFKNKMQAMKPITAHFGNTVEGNVLRKILEELSS